jgi:endonuclease I
MELKRTFSVTVDGIENRPITFTLPVEDEEGRTPELRPLAKRSDVITEFDLRHDPDIVAALALARRNRDATEAEYYDRDADAQARHTYYQGIDERADPTAFYSALSRLVAKTHRTRLQYRPAVHLYPDVDLQPNGRITSIYSARDMNPEDLIRADAAVDLARQAAVRALMDMRTASPDDMAIYISRIEAAFPYNCEHVVPQSWFRKRDPMKGDLHHLFACEIKCNEFRANIPYYDFAQDSINRADCGQATSNRFEPVGGKGAVARATLYFLLRYPHEIDNNDREYTRDRLGVLLKWARDHPVTLYEQHRNCVIQRKQGNRNPLIDFPDWAERIDFTQGLQSHR